MAEANSNVNMSGCVGVLLWGATILLFILKVTGVVAELSWWIVFAPAMVSVGMFLLMLVLAVVGYFAIRGRL